ncbi:MAG: cobalamin biosynthesis protein, partial [Bacteroidaceae bacterium]|nr:cobalamin biosynthesis protein [Bacteroidaceae bacterium]
MKIAIIPISEAGSEIAVTLQRQLGAKSIQRTEVKSKWKNYDAFIFIGAMGICVRTIAPLVEDKHKDPAVVCIDSFGQHVISVLSGHVGGANDLTREVAAIIGGREVITTQSDNAGLWALDTFAERFNWAVASDDDMNECIFAFVNREPTALLMDICDEGTDYLEKTLPEHVTVVKSIEDIDPKKFKLAILVTPYNLSVPYGMLELHFVPMIAALGFGLAHHPKDYEDIYDEIDEAMNQMGVLPCYKRYCTIDVKEDEEFCAMLVDDLEEELVFYTAEELAKVEVPNPSKTVAQHVGTPSVCEAAAILGANNGKLIVPKVKGKNWTAALAIDYKYLRMLEGHIEIVGAGPGDPDLISVRGRRMLERADLILYAGSLVPKALTECHKPGAVVRSSADMNL